jgi:hypothetical protein
LQRERKIARVSVGHRVELLMGADKKVKNF